jgi:hypothetical protein
MHERDRGPFPEARVGLYRPRSGVIGLIRSREFRNWASIQMGYSARESVSDASNDCNDNETVAMCFTFIDLPDVPSIGTFRSVSVSTSDISQSSLQWPDTCCIVLTQKCGLSLHDSFCAFVKLASYLSRDNKQKYLRGP